MVGQLDGVAHQWTLLGRDDPMWAALTDSGKRGAWSVAEFLDTGRREIEAVLALLKRRHMEVRTGTAVDFGCGPGRLSAGLAASGFDHVIGVDVSSTMLETAHQIVPEELAVRCEFLLNEGRELSAIPDDSVDLVYSSRVLQHMPAAIAHTYIGEFLRVAAPGAPVVFQVPFEPVGGLVGSAMKVVPQQLLDRIRRGMQMHGTSPAEITRIIADFGGRTVSIEEDSSAGPRWRSFLFVAQA